MSVRVTARPRRSSLVGAARAGVAAALIPFAVAASHRVAEAQPRGRSAEAAAAPLARTNARLVDLEAEVRMLADEPIELEPRRSPTFAEERLTEAELHYRMRDYERAAILLTDLVDRAPRDAELRVRPNALFLLGEALFHAGDHFGARTRLRELLSHAGEAGFRPYAERALARLIDIAIRTRSFDEVEGYFEILRRDPSLVAEASTTYFRGKYLYNRAIEPVFVVRTGRPDLPRVHDAAMLEQARATFETVAEATPYHPQAVYFVAVIHALRGEHEAAAEAFRAVLELEPATAEHRQVRELARLSLARVLLEAHELRDALSAYEAVPETSRHYPAALFEGAWVHVRRNATDDAERALAVMIAVAPDEPRVPDAMILRGHLLVQDERYDEADALFEELRQRFEPLRLELEAVPAEHPDLRAHFRPIVRTHLSDLGAEDFLPPSVRTFLTPHGHFGRALTILSDLAAAKRDVATIEDLVVRLRAVLEAPNPITVLRDLRAERERVEVLSNRAAAIRAEVAAAEASADPAAGSELERVRAERRGLERTIAAMPAERRDFERRDGQVVLGYRSLAEQLPELHRAVLTLEARVHAAEHALRTARGDAAIDASPELAEMRAAVHELRRAIRAAERGLEAGRLRVGVGDERTVEEVEARRRLSSLVAEERRLAQAAGAGPGEDALRRVAALEATLEARAADIDAATRHRVGAMLEVVHEEAGNLDGYLTAVATLSAQAEEVVTEVVVHNYQLARQRLYDLVLRADLGHVEVGWARRESHRRELETLTRQRVREVDGVDRERAAILDLPLAPELDEEDGP